ncbi:hypothetical protein Bca101_080708 [Brassica carinata]
MEARSELEGVPLVRFIKSQRDHKTDEISSNQRERQTERGKQREAKREREVEPLWWCGVVVSGGVGYKKIAKGGGDELTREKKIAEDKRL